MAIAPVQSGGTLTPNAASGSRTTGSNVTAGNRIIIKVFVFTGASNDPFIVGDLTKTGGTATLDTITLDAEENVEYNTPNFIACGIWSALVTGTGSLTMTCTGAAGYFWCVAIEEFSGNWDSTFLEDTSVNSTTTNNTNSDSGSASSAGDALFAGVLVTTNNGGTVTITIDTDYTLVIENENDDTDIVGASAYRISSGALTDAFTATLGNNLGWASALAVYREAAAPPDPTATVFLLTA